LHARLRRHRSLHGNVFRHRPPHQRRQGQAAPGNHCSRSRQQRPAASGPRADSSSSARRQCCFEENVLAWTEGTCDQCAACACTRRRTCAHVELQHARSLAGAHACMPMHVARRRRGFERRYLPGQKEHVISARRRACAHVERRHARAHTGTHACRAVAVRAGEGCILVMQSFTVSDLRPVTGAGKSIVSCTTG
jgi:hypothetical protein